MKETVPKDTLCVPEKCHGVMPNSWLKSLSMQRRIDHGIESLSEAKAHAKKAYRMMPSKLAVLRKQSKKLSSSGVSRPIQAPWEAPVLSLKKKDRNPQQCIDRDIQIRHLIKVLSSKNNEGKGTRDNLCHWTWSIRDHVVKCHQSGLLREEDTQWSGNLECQAAFNDLKQAMIEGPSLGSSMRPSLLKLNLRNATFGHNTQTDSLIRRIQFEIKGNRHFVLPLLANDPYIEDSPQAHRVEEEWEQMANIA
ncbi:RNA-directed DNA polymerase-like protein [Cucumis melo var. makuwa]|uniref:RNA-directed DNA polymerase-like protein n=1 Tax=Cucumis melo var. makuwa TaxID=1194695 RepID=A0A5A7TW40_CUCMM|nr:RNA-directed DNA polymerase-like protein [Cucumis melo var. makuwa]TYK30510.1 RNA-directed DNA polymerase-like protein [Cucumis melo var. makuwa]